MDEKIEVMVVDDEADFRALMRVWLESKGYSVVEASDGEAAIAMIKKNKPGIVFLDLNMPIMGGVDTVYRLRKFDKHLPVIIISAYLNQLGAAEMKKYNIAGVFYKGEEFEKGLNLLETVLRMHKKLKK
jgi:Response regulator containing CheY-like receiver, AAA-type ATPase, and DNA-binding domains